MSLHRHVPRDFVPIGNRRHGEIMWSSSTKIMDKPRIRTSVHSTKRRQCVRCTSSSATSSDCTLIEWATLAERSRQTLRTLYRFRPFNRVTIPMLPMHCKATSNVFIPPKVTSHLMKNKLVRERFQSTKRLFQFLDWTMTMNKTTQNMVVMEGQNGSKVLLFDVELHDPRRQNLYALCIPNTIQIPKALSWRLVGLLTADMITKWMDIDSPMLPRGVRLTSHHFSQYREMRDNLKEIKREILEIDATQNGNRYAHLQCIRPEHSKSSVDKVMTVRASMFHQVVQSALKKDNVSLIPIVSRTSNNHFRYFEIDSVWWLVMNRYNFQQLIYLHIECTCCVNVHYIQCRLLTPSPSGR